MEPFVSVVNHEGKPSVKIKIGTKCHTYPLTKSGCLQAGQELYEAGAEIWMYSSSVDFPEVVKPRCKLNIRQLMDQGFQKARQLAEAPRNSMVNKMIAFCEKDDFQSTLTKEEKLAFIELAERVAEAKTKS